MEKREEKEREKKREREREAVFSFKRNISKIVFERKGERTVSYTHLTLPTKA